ncbi:excisionase family DNA-binding protein [Pseudaminobacter sp. NGMCC 1.201702]|uniref:excisionase family DNA-binding protein n=1 Tax=Pseudaminobacter sp. NGMCC 1.201702 TaxID=3391825 RepID=UPI0039F028C1
MTPSAKAVQHAQTALAEALQLMQLENGKEIAIEKLAYSVPEAAYALSLSIDYVWKLVAMGTIPSVKVGKRRLVPAAALKEFFESR